MSSNGKLLFLGTGGSLGIPVVGCRCAVCISKAQHNKRLRPSALIEMGGKRFLLDCGPDFRTQALTHGISSLDGVILTHSHHDHCSGIDELRIFTFKRGTTLPCVMSHETHEDLIKRFYYIFSTENLETKYTTNFSPTILPGRQGAINLNGWKVRFCTYSQGGMNVNGFRFGDLAFFTDVKDYDESVFELTQGVNTLIINALRFTPSPLHLTVDEALEFSQKVGASRVFFTHIAHELDHEATNAYLPPNTRLAYDGLELSFSPEKV